jgi:hypothetical protein
VKVYTKKQIDRIKQEARIKEYSKGYMRGVDSTKMLLNHTVVVVHKDDVPIYENFLPDARAVYSPSNARKANLSLLLSSERETGSHTV